MKVQPTSICNYKNDYKQNHTSTFQKSRVIDEGEYIKVPREKYYRDKLLGGAVTLWLILDLIIDCSKKSPDESLTKKLLDMLSKIKKK